MNDRFAPEDDDFATDQAPALGTQLLALATAACVGTALLLSNVLLGVILFAAVLGWMYLDAGTGWVERLRRRAARRDCRILRHILIPR